MTHVVHVEHFVTNTICFVTDTIHFAMTIYYGKLRHSCDDPVCPDSSWKLSRRLMQNTCRLRYLTCPTANLRTNLNLRTKILDFRGFDSSIILEFEGVEFPGPQGITRKVWANKS